MLLLTYISKKVNFYCPKDKRKASKIHKQQKKRSKQIVQLIGYIKQIAQNK